MSNKKILSFIIAYTAVINPLSTNHHIRLSNRVVLIYAINKAKLTILAQRINCHLMTDLRSVLLLSASLSPNAKGIAHAVISGSLRSSQTSKSLINLHTADNINWLMCTLSLIATAFLLNKRLCLYKLAVAKTINSSTITNNWLHINTPTFSFVLHKD